MRSFKWKKAVNLTEQEAKVYTENWNLTEQEQEKLDNYCLRQWSALELAEAITFPTNSDVRVRLWHQEFMPIFTGPKEIWQKIMYLAVRDRAENDPLNNKQPMYWLSFRSGLVEGKRFSYVIIQEDRK